MPAVDPKTKEELSQFDLSLIRDFRDEFNQAYESITASLFELESKPDNIDQINNLFRTVHSVKSNLRMLCLNDLSAFVHSIENVMDQMRAGKLQFTLHIGDMFLLGLNRVRDEFELHAAGRAGHVDEITNICDAINTIDGEQDIAQRVRHVMSLLDPSFLAAGTAVVSPENDDLAFFASLVHFVEGRSLSPQGRTERILAMANEINTAAKQPVDPRQLSAAVYLHDIGMAFLPADLLKKQGTLTVEDLAILRSHAALGAQLLGQLGIWSEASQMVEQHHERYDGGGYPCGLGQNAICHGAKIIAIADTFEAMSHARADGREKRPMLRVVAEVNAHSGGQFDPIWVEIFNRVIRLRYVKPRT